MESVSSQFVVPSRSLVRACILFPLSMPWILLLFFSWTGLCGAMTPLQHMTNHCGKTVLVNQSLLLDLTEDLEPDRVLVGHLSCAVTLEASRGSRLYLHVLQLAISDKADNPDRLHIYEASDTGATTRRLTPNTGLYGVLERPYLIYNTAGVIVPDFRTAGQRMRLDYQGKPTVMYRGFRLLFTSFSSQRSDGTCGPGALFCPYAGTCVPISTRCDSLPNCGLDDDQDERGCHRMDVVSNLLEEYSLRTAIVAGVAGIFVFLGVAALVFFFIAKYNSKKQRGGTSQSVLYTSRGGGACQYLHQAEPTTLYAPPSYEDVMVPVGNRRPRVSKASMGPPPTYSAAVAALIHKDASHSDYSDDEPDPSRQHQEEALELAEYKSKHQRPPSRQTRRLDPEDAAQGPGCQEDAREIVRLHDARMHDLGEGEEVMAKGQRKGGKNGQRKAPSASYSRFTATTHHGATLKRCALPGPDYPKASAEVEHCYDKGPIHDRARFPEDRQCVRIAGKMEDSDDQAPSSITIVPPQSREPVAGRSPLHGSTDSSAGSVADVVAPCLSVQARGGPADPVSETESQQAAQGHRRKSTTESNSPSSCCSQSSRPLSSSSDSSLSSPAPLAAPSISIPTEHNLDSSHTERHLVPSSDAL